MTFLEPFSRLTISSVLDILVVGFVIYQLFVIVRGTRAAHILIGILIIFAVYVISVRLGLEALRTLLSYLIPYSAIATVILFQSEIRRTLARLGRKNWLGHGFKGPESASEIVMALGRLAESHTGALLVLERDIGLRTFVESGVRLDAEISRDLVLAIFQPGAALHDGAVIIQKEKISAAACFLPLSTNPAISLKLGTRHRAAIGITEETDCMALVVSEETGWISVATFGNLESKLTPDGVDERIHRHFGSGKYRLVTGSSITVPPADEPAVPAEKAARL